MKVWFFAKMNCFYGLQMTFSKMLIHWKFLMLCLIFKIDNKQNPYTPFFFNLWPLFLYNHGWNIYITSCSLLWKQQQVCYIGGLLLYPLWVNLTLGRYFFNNVSIAQGVILIDVNPSLANKAVYIKLKKKENGMCSWL